MEKIFEVDKLTGKNGLELLFKEGNLSTDAIDAIYATLNNAFSEDILSFEMNSHVLPNEMMWRNKCLEMDWIPMENDNDELTRLLLSIRDVTEINQLKEQAQEKKKEVECLMELVNLDIEKFFWFAESSSEYLQKTQDFINKNNEVSNENIQEIYRDIHTIKGNSRFLATSYVTDAAHKFEELLRESKEDNRLYNESIWRLHVNAISSELEYYKNIAEYKLGGNKQANLLSNSEQETLRELFFENKSNPKYQNILEPIFRPLVFRSSLKNVLSSTLESMSDIANELGKPAPKIEIADNFYQFDNSLHTFLINSFGHLLRNSMDHGIESPERRVENGKSEQGKITVEVEELNNTVRIVFKDDGAGLNIQKIAKKAVKTNFVKNNVELTWDTITKVILSSGFSVKQEATEISGRGVGLDAVLQYAQEIGGKFTLEPLASFQPNAAYIPIQFIIEVPKLAEEQTLKAA